MSTSHVHSVSSHHRSATPAPAHKPAKSHASPANQESKVEKSEPQAHRNRADGTSLSEEAREALEAEQPAVAGAKDPNAKDPGNPKDAEEGSDSKDLLDARKKEIEDLKKLLEEMKKQAEEDKKDKAEDKPPQDLGGCCGKSHGSPEAGDKGADKDPNSVLLADVAAVKLEKGQGGAGAGTQAGGKQAGLHQAGQPGVGNQPALGAIPQGGSALAKLQQDYTQFKQQGATIRPEVEQIVQSTLGGAGGAVKNPLQPGMPGIQGAGAVQPAGHGLQGVQAGGLRK